MPVMMIPTETANIAETNATLLFESIKDLVKMCTRPSDSAKRMKLTYFSGLQSKQKKNSEFRYRRIAPRFLSLCFPHLIQLMVSPVLPAP